MTARNMQLVLADGSFVPLTTPLSWNEFGFDAPGGQNMGFSSAALVLLGENGNVVMPVGDKFYRLNGREAKAVELAFNEGTISAVGTVSIEVPYPIESVHIRVSYVSGAPDPAKVGGWELAERNVEGPFTVTGGQLEVEIIEADFTRVHHIAAVLDEDGYEVTPATTVDVITAPSVMVVMQRPMTPNEF